MGERIPARKFQDLIAWQRARTLTRDVYEATTAGQFTRDYGLQDQMRRSAVSVMSNVAEGFDRESAAEFHRFLTIAKASCAELRSQLYVALDANHLTEAHFSRLMEQAEEVAAIIKGLRSAVEKKREIPKRDIRK